MSYKIGITGGIGAGKTTVSQIFSILGIPVYNADQRAKHLMVTDRETRAGIIALLGPEAYIDSDLNRAWIAEQVFSDIWKLNKLNAVVHPAVEQDYRRWHGRHELSAYTLKEAALLFDAGSYLTLDATIVVTASEEVRIERVMGRDKMSGVQVRERINQQWPEDRRLLLADFLIDNNGDVPLIPQIMRIHKELSTP